jgi:hypothetical protein
MSQQIGVVQSSNDDGGFLSCVAVDPKSIPFRAIDVNGYGSLVMGEPVCFDLVRGANEVHAKGIKRSMENLDLYPSMGGLYS